ncbi:MAG: hypothetical protein U1F65_10145 [Verrucomicrobiota bacterium]
MTKVHLIRNASAHARKTSVPASGASGAARILTVSFDASSAERQFAMKLVMKANPLFQPAHPPVRLGGSVTVRRSTVAPSLRLRASAASRSLLRWSRAAERSPFNEALRADGWAAK